MAAREAGPPQGLRQDRAGRAAEAQEPAFRHRGGVRAPASYTVQAAVDDWLAQGLSGRSERTLTLYRDGVKPLTDRIGARQLRKLTAAAVRSALAGLSGELSTRSLQIAHNCLVRAIRQAKAGDIVARNVAALVKTPARFAPRAGHDPPGCGSYPNLLTWAHRGRLRGDGHFRRAPGRPSPARALLAVSAVAGEGRAQ